MRSGLKGCSGQASLELLVIVSAMVSMLSFTAASVSNVADAGENAVALRAADSLLHALDNACQVAISSGSPQTVEADLPVPVIIAVDSAGGGMEASFESSGKQLNVVLSKTWCSGRASSGIKADSGKMIIVSPSGVLQT